MILFRKLFNKKSWKMLKQEKLYRDEIFSLTEALLRITFEQMGYSAKRLTFLRVEKKSYRFELHVCVESKKIKFTFYDLASRRKGSSMMGKFAGMFFHLGIRTSPNAWKVNPRRESSIADLIGNKKVMQFAIWYLSTYEKGNKECSKYFLNEICEINMSLWDVT